MRGSGPGPAAGRWDGESLWEFARARGMDRRRFLELMVTGGAAAVLAACTGTELPSGTPQPTQVGPGPAQGWSNIRQTHTPGAASILSLSA